MPLGALGMVQAEAEANDATSSLGTLRNLGVPTALPQPAQGFLCMALSGTAKGDPKGGKEKSCGMLELQPGYIKSSQSCWVIPGIPGVAGHGCAKGIPSGPLGEFAFGAAFQRDAGSFIVSLGFIPSSLSDGFGSGRVPAAGRWH